jgi:hypothetical protein
VQWQKQKQKSRLSSRLFYARCPVLEVAAVFVILCLCRVQQQGASADKQGAGQ